MQNCWEGRQQPVNMKKEFVPAMLSDSFSSTSLFSTTTTSSLITRRHLPSPTAPADVPPLQRQTAGSTLQLSTELLLRTHSPGFKSSFQTFALLQISVKSWTYSFLVNKRTVWPCFMGYTFHKVLYFTQIARKVFIHIVGEKPKLCVSEQSSCGAKLESTEDKALGAKDPAACV